MDARTLEKKLKFIDDYKKAINASTGSKYDANSNVTTKCIATLQTELGKKDLIDLNRALTKRYLTDELAAQYEDDIRNHIIYSHDESSIMPYCIAISLYPFLLDGLQTLGGTSSAPQHANSYIGGIINLIFLISGQFAGAVAVPEFIPYFDHFLRKDYGEDYIKRLDDVIEAFGNRAMTLRDKIEDWFQQFVYSVNQPAGARNYQSPFTNIAYFDKGYFSSIFKDFVFPDGDEPNWESTKELQKMYMEWFNNERTKSVITFPVETMNLLWDRDTKKYVDEEMADFTAEMWAKGHSFFLYNSDSADALSSCCFSGNEFITIVDKKTGEPKTTTLKELCEYYKEGSGNLEKVLSNPEYQILSYNKDTGENELVDIDGVLIKDNEYQRLIEIESEDGNVIKVTPNHEVVVKNLKTNDIEEIYAMKLVDNLDNYVLIEELKECKITSCTVVESDAKVYDIQLEKNHLFYANSILSHNCRLKNSIEENVFSYTLGAGGIQTGSKKVITLNMNRIVQNWDREGRKVELRDYIRPIVKRVHAYLSAYNDYLWDLYENDLLTVYKAGYISLDKQYLTVGFNGFLEAAEYLGIETKPNSEGYKKLAKDVLGTIKEINLEDRTERCKFNTEQVPAENLGAKNYAWDKKDGYWVPDGRECYNSYFYPVEDPSYDIVTKMYLQGRDFSGCLDGGSAYHCNLSEHLSKKQYRLLMDVAIQAGCGYFTFNCPNTICNECGHIDKRYLHECPKCGSKNVDYATRVIGYLKRVSNFPEVRQKEAAKRAYERME